MLIYWPLRPSRTVMRGGGGGVGGVTTFSSFKAALTVRKELSCC